MNRKILIWSGIIFAAIILISGGYYFSQKQTEPEFTETRENVTICYYAPLAGLITITQDQDFFSQNGLNVTLRKYPIRAKTAFESIFTGECDIATASETYIVTRNRKDFSIFASIGTSDNNTKIIARADRGIQKPGDLRGKRIATSKGTNPHFFLYVFLLKNVISEDNVTIIFGNIEELPQMLERGEIDAFSLPEPYIYRAKKLLGDKAIVFAEPGLSITKFNIVALNSYIKDRPEVIDRTLLALIQAEEYVKNHNNETIKILSKQYGINESEISAILADTNLIVALDQDLLFALEDETRWAIKSKQTNRTIVPNYLDFIYMDSLERIKPKAVTIIR